MTNYKAAVGEISDSSLDLNLKVDANLVTGLEQFEKKFGTATSLEADLLTLSSAILACDLAFKRGERESFNSRVIELTVPVVNLAAFNNVKKQIQIALYSLSRDCWELKFVGKFGQPEIPKTWSTGEGQTLLFSGGLDSLAAAVMLIETIGFENILLASHQTGNPTVTSSQSKLIHHLNDHYGIDLDRIILTINPQSRARWLFPALKDREETQRTRSFLFAAIAALGARRSGKKHILMIGENGQMAIHLPISTARAGAFSTHTAHPHFVKLIGEIFSDLLQCNLTFENPFLYKTKGEVVSILVEKHRKALPMSTSCWRRVPSKFNHCGECIPCLVRRIAIESQGIQLVEYKADPFNKNLLHEKYDNEGKRNTLELMTFVQMFATKSPAQLLDEIPDLYSPYFDQKLAIEMYKRFAAEAQFVISQYPTLKKAM